MQALLRNLVGLGDLGIQDPCKFTNPNGAYYEAGLISKGPLYLQIVSANIRLFWTDSSLLVSARYLQVVFLLLNCVLKYG